jgi:hypothetical protein
MSNLAQIKGPCLLEPVDGVIVVEPLRFISLQSIAATRRQSLIRNASHNSNLPIHCSPSSNGKLPHHV